MYIYIYTYQRYERMGPQITSVKRALATCVYVYIQALTHTHAHTCTHMHTHAHTHKDTNTHIRIHTGRDTEGRALPI